MKSKEKGIFENKGKSSMAIILYIAAAVVAFIGIALLIDNIYIYKTTIDQYITQGYPAAEVKKSLIPAQLLPGIFDPIAVYGGIAFILLGLGMADKKLSRFLASQPKPENDKEIEAESNLKQDEAASENPEFIEPADIH